MALVIKRGNGSLEVLTGPTLLNDGTRASLETLTYMGTPQLAAISIQSVPDPTPPQGQQLTGVAYQLAGDGVTIIAVGTFSVIPVAPLGWAPIIVLKALQTISKAKADLFINKMSDSDRAAFTSADQILASSSLLATALAAPGVGISLTDLQAAINGLSGNGKV